MFGVIRKPVRDPMLALLYNLERRMGKYFNEPFGLYDWQLPEFATAAWTPAVDVFETPEFVRIVAEIPGVKPDAVKITVENNVLTIQGTKEPLVGGKGEEAYRYGGDYGGLERSVSV